MIKEIGAERLIEIEEMVKNDEIIFPIYHEEYLYYKLAKKIPIDKMIMYFNVYKKNWPFIDKLQMSNILKIVFNCTDYELENRIYTVHKIMQYKNQKLNNLLKNRKKMIKKMKR